MDSSQRWFFLFEGMSKTDYVQASKTFDEVITAGVSFHSMLSFVGKDNANPGDYNFFIFGESMKAAVQLLTNKSIFVTYRLYCEDDEVVTIIVRPADDPSPNSSQCPSAPSSLRERRKISGKRSLQNVTLRSTSQGQTQNLDAETLLPINELPASEKIGLDLGQGRVETFSVSYLLGWIMAEVERGTPLHEITVTSITPKDRPVNIKLDHDVWTRTLLRSTEKARFREIWSQFSEATVFRTDALDSLSLDYPAFYKNAKIFIQDLKRFASRPDSQTRLLSTEHKFFLGEPYFSAEAVEKILALPLHPSTLEANLKELMDKKAERGQSDELCASHDLAPVFLRAFGLSWDAFKNEKLVLSSTEAKKSSKSLKRRSTMGALNRAFSKLKAKDEQKGIKGK